MNKLLSYKSGSADVALLIARLGLGVVFIANGWNKFQGIDMVVDFFGGLTFFGVESLQVPGALAYVVAAIELLGGIAILLGVFTHWSGKALAAVMIGAIVTAKWGNPITGQSGIQLDIALLALALVVAFLGPGKYAVHTSPAKKAELPTQPPSMPQQPSA